MFILNVFFGGGGCYLSVTAMRYSDDLRLEFARKKTVAYLPDVAAWHLLMANYVKMTSMYWKSGEWIVTAWYCQLTEMLRRGVVLRHASDEHSALSLSRKSWDVLALQGWSKVRRFGSRLRSWRSAWSSWAQERFRPARVWNWDETIFSWH